MSHCNSQFQSIRTYTIFALLTCRTLFFSGDEGGAAGCDYQSSLGEARMGIDSSSDHSGPSMAASLPQEDEEDEEEEEEEDDEDLLAGPEDDDGDFT